MASDDERAGGDHPIKPSQGQKSLADDLQTTLRKAWDYAYRLRELHADRSREAQEWRQRAEDAEAHLERRVAELRAAPGRERAEDAEASRTIIADGQTNLLADRLNALVARVNRLELRVVEGARTPAPQAQAQGANP